MLGQDLSHFSSYNTSYNLFLLNLATDPGRARGLGGAESVRGPLRLRDRDAGGGQESRAANDHDRDQIFGLDCRQQSIPINFWLNRPQQHDRDIV